MCMCVCRGAFRSIFLKINCRLQVAFILNYVCPGVVRRLTRRATIAILFNARSTGMIWAGARIVIELWVSPVFQIRRLWSILHHFGYVRLVWACSYDGRGGALRPWGVLIVFYIGVEVVLLFLSQISNRSPRPLKLGKPKDINKKTRIILYGNTSSYAQCGPNVDEIERFHRFRVEPHVIKEIIWNWVLLFLSFRLLLTLRKRAKCAWRSHIQHYAILMRSH